MEQLSSKIMIYIVKIIFIKTIKKMSNIFRQNWLPFREDRFIVDIPYSPIIYHNLDGTGNELLFYLYLQNSTIYNTVVNHVSFDFEINGKVFRKFNHIIVKEFKTNYSEEFQFRFNLDENCINHLKSLKEDCNHYNVDIYLNINFTTIDGIKHILKKIRRILRFHVSK